MEKNNYEIIIFTPYYPIMHRTDLEEDTKAVYYLLKESPDNMNILVAHTYFHGFKKTMAMIFKLKKFKKNNYYKGKDLYGNDLVFMEFLLMIPKKLNTISFFYRKYSRILKEHYQRKYRFPHILVFHMPTCYRKLIKFLQMDVPKIAIIHSFDIKNIRDRKTIKYWKNYMETFQSIGFRSYVIKKEYEELLGIAQNSFLVHSGLPNNFLQGSNVKRSYHQEDKVKFIFVGKLNENKNLESVLKALEVIKEVVKFELKIIGVGPQEALLKKMAKDLGIINNVKFIGKVSREKSFEEMKKSDIFIMTSKKETLGLVYLEAMAAGCIVIGSKGQGIDGIIKDGENGYLTDSRNIKEISDKILETVYLSQEKQDEIRSRAEHTISNLSDSKVSQDYFAHISLYGLKGLSHEKN
ncbi:glycosyltransferase [Planococcus wigleyi]|uniref:Glycosyltransferase family 4 protein n=1 Tax=Planococcus wigleyi TaxID=2762216 RepID=A0ABR8W8M7_9BACL|nr:glycosyltransferase [Planococcus wigleyi]MBD8013368.1 glycosyltransferase family 4 protein [Planococcus wigleyi]